tara:strand:+ start:324 stop:530 length:207 start_codon:yes stop_codon:yes gene_type:complete
MISYEILLQIEGDQDKHSNYYVNVYQSPSSENSVLAERSKEMDRILRKPIITIASDSNNRQPKGDKYD